MKRLILLALLVAACAPPEPTSAPTRPVSKRFPGTAASARASASAAPTAEPGRELPLDRTMPRTLAATRNFRNGRPTKVWVSGDGGTVFFLRSEARNPSQSLYKLDVASGDERKILDVDQILKGPETVTPEERARRERLRQTATGITSFEITKNELGIVVPVGGRLWFFDRMTGKVRELATGDGVVDPQLSPDGTKVAYVRTNDVFIIDIAEGARELQVTRGGTDVKPNGLAEFIAQEEFDREHGFYFSPDGQSIAFEEADQSMVENLFLADPASPEREPDRAFYPRPGKKNADVKFGVVSIRGGSPTWLTWDRAKFPYVATMTWQENAPLALYVLDRAQQNGLLLAADAKTGATKTLVSEHDDAWLNVDVTVPRFMPDGKTFLWSTERDGAWALEVRGELLPKTIVPASKGYRRVADLDGSRGVVRVEANPDPTMRSLVTLDVSTGVEKSRLGDGGFTETTFGRSHETFFASIGTLEGWPHYEIVTPTTRRLVGNHAEVPPALPSVEIRTVGPDAMRVAIVYPQDRAMRHKMPIVDAAYGGPGVNVVKRELFNYVRAQYVADALGAVVVAIDAKGTPGRDRAWERAIRGNFTLPVEGHVNAIRLLASEIVDLDASRVGVYGWSFGGYFTVAATLLHPELFKVGVAGAAPADWRDYDTAYTERYLGMPDQDKAAYDRSSLLTLAAIDSPLPRPLLLLHGTADDNVYFRNTLRLAEALARANKPFALVPFLGEAHSMRAVLAVETQWVKTIEFLRDNLASPQATTQYPHYL
ncbi:S9 family peptidase [soil metagenome]